MQNYIISSACVIHFSKYFNKTFKSNFKQLFENVCKQTAKMPTMAFWLVFNISLSLNLLVHKQLFFEYLLPE